MAFIGKSLGAFHLGDVTHVERDLMRHATAPVHARKFHHEEAPRFAIRARCVGDAENQILGHMCFAFFYDLT